MTCPLIVYWSCLLLGGGGGGGVWALSFACTFAFGTMYQYVVNAGMHVGNNGMWEILFSFLRRSPTAVGGVCEVCPLQRLPGQDPIEGVGSVKCVLLEQDPGFLYSGCSL